MKNFWKNVSRTARKNLGTYLGASCIIALGIFIYIAMMDTLHNLEDQIDIYYKNYSMADVFAQVSSIPLEELEQLKDIPGVKEVYGRLGRDVRLLFDGQTEVVTLHLLAYNEGDVLNRLRVPKEKLEEDEISLGSKMMDAYGYEEGDLITILINGDAKTFSLAGSCYAPEYIYAIPPGGAMIPDGEIYDIACMDKREMEALLGEQGIANELGFSLFPGYTYEDVRYHLKERLEPFGLTSLCERADQPSVTMVDGEINELISMGSILPIIFMAISVFMLYIVLRKIIDRDRSLIGTMKAFGYKDSELILTYLRQGISIGVVGAVAGSVLAVPFGRFMFQIYAGFFNLPDTVYHSYVDTRITGTAIALGTSMTAVYLGVRGILKIAPAEAMRAAAPAANRTFRIPAWIGKWLNTMQKMGCRSIARSPMRIFLIGLAIAFPFGMTAVLFSFTGVANQMFYDQFSKVQTYDIQASLDRYVSLLRAGQAGEELDGVVKSEAVGTFSLELKNENLTSFAMLYALNRGSELYRIMDMYGKYYEPPGDGLIINSRMAADLHAAPGDTIEIFNAALAPEAVKIPISAVISESLGSGCYMDIESMQKYFNMESAANTILLKVRPGALQEVKDQLLKTSRVTYIVDTARILNGYQGMLKSMMAMMNLFAAMAVVTGMILIYNISVISIRERKTEFGTLTIMGISDREIWQMVSFEQLVYFFIGIAMGFPVSFLFQYIVESLIVSDTYTIEMNITPRAYAAGFFTCMLVAAVSCVSVMRIIRKIEPTDILKERE